MYYINSRYPDAFPENAPIDYFQSEHAEKALLAAKMILDKVNHELE